MLAMARALVLVLAKSLILLILAITVLVDTSSLILAREPLTS